LSFCGFCGESLPVHLKTAVNTLFGSTH
jgi:hypothetical protein